MAAGEGAPERPHLRMAGERDGGRRSAARADPARSRGALPGGGYGGVAGGRAGAAGASGEPFAARGAAGEERRAGRGRARVGRARIERPGDGTGVAREPRGNSPEVIVEGGSVQ